MRRALRARSEGFGGGALADFYVVWEGRPTAVGGSPERAREALRPSRCESPAAVAPRRSSVTPSRSRRAPGSRRVRAHCSQQALAIDPDAAPEHRLANLISQRRARWLLARADELFVE